MKLRSDVGSGAPLTSSVLPVSGMVLDVVLWTSSLVPFMLIVLPPGLAAVPRSTDPPATRMAGWEEVVELCTTVLSRTTRLPPLTRMVGALVAVTSVTPLAMVVCPELTTSAGELPITVTLPWTVTVPDVTRS